MPLLRPASLFAMALLVCACEDRGGTLTGSLWDSQIQHSKSTYDEVSVQYLDDKKSVAILLQKRWSVPGADLAFVYEIPGDMPRDVKTIVRCEITEAIVADYDRNTISGDGALKLTFIDNRSFVITSSKVGTVNRSDLEVMYKSDKIAFTRDFGVIAKGTQRRSLAGKIALTPLAVTGDAALGTLEVGVGVATLPLWLPLMLFFNSTPHAGQHGNNN